MPQPKPIPECKLVSELLESPERWTKEHLAITKTGRKVSPSSKTAIAFCIVGAICRVYQTKDQNSAIRKMARFVGSKFITDWELIETRTHAEVLAACRKAGI